MDVCRQCWKYSLKLGVCTQWVWMDVCRHCWKYSLTPFIHSAQQEWGSVPDYISQSPIDPVSPVSHLKLGSPHQKAMYAWSPIGVKVKENYIKSWGCGYKCMGGGVYVVSLSCTP